MESISITIFSACFVSTNQKCVKFHLQNENIRYLLANKGLFDETVNILGAIQNYNKNCYGAENHTTLITKHSIAHCLYGVGKHKETLEIFYQIDDIHTIIVIYLDSIIHQH